MNTTSGWQLSGDGPDAYERYVVPAFTRTWAQEMVKRACLRGDERILDAACGSGIVARTAAAGHRTDLICGVDVNEIMINKARDIETAIAWHHSDVTSMPFDDCCFDVILCQQGLQYFPDQVGALTQMQRVLADHGRIILSVWRPIEYSPFYDALCRLLEKYVSRTAASMLAAAYSIGDADTIKELFEYAGFSTVHITIVVKQMRFSPFDEFVMGGMMASPFFKDIQEMPAADREAFLLEMALSNQDYLDDDGLAAPMESYIVSAEKGKRKAVL